MVYDYLEFLATDPFTVESFEDMISKKYEPSEIANSPHQFVNSNLSHRINEICFDKYLINYVKPEEETGSRESNSDEMTAASQVTNTQSTSNSQQKSEVSQASHKNGQVFLFKRLFYFSICNFVNNLLLKGDFKAQRIGVEAKRRARKEKEPAKKEETFLTNAICFYANFFVNYFYT